MNFLSEEFLKHPYIGCILIICTLIFFIKLGHNHKNHGYILKWLTAVICIIISAIYLVNYFMVPIKMLAFIRSAQFGSYFDSVKLIFGLGIIQIAFCFSEWFEWLKDWQLTFNAKVAKNVLQLSYVGMAVGYNYWITHYHVYAPKSNLTGQRYLNAGYAAASVDINYFIISMVGGLLVPFVILLLIAGVLKAIQYFNQLPGKKRYFFMEPKDNAKK